MTDAAKQTGAPALVVALDVPDRGAALTLARRFSGLPLWLKVGLELFTAEGPELVRGLLAADFPVFLDLKFHDIPHTVQGAVRSAVSLGAGMATVHLGGGESMCRAAVRGRDEAGNAGFAKTLLMGVTVLTSDGGDAASIEALVLERALLAKACGFDGVVCSGREAAAVKRVCGEDFLCLCPGIRFAGTAGRDDQARTSTPEQAVAAGADFVVMGRPVTRAEDPASVAALVVESLNKAAACRK